MGTPVNTLSQQSKADPVIPVQIGDEKYFIVFDYSVVRAIVRETGINPMTQGLFPIINQDGGIEKLFYCMLTQFGKKQPIPEEQREIEFPAVEKWFEDLSLYTTFYTLIAAAYAVAMNDVTEKIKGKPEGEESRPPQKESTTIS